MNVTDKIFSDEDYRKKYFEKMDALNVQKNMFIDFTKRMNELDEKRKKTDGKKRKRNGVLVNGATNKDSIRKMKRVLQQKISEVIAEEGDVKLKNLQVSELSNKIAALDRILAQIERHEREKIQNNQRKNKKDPNSNRIESVYLTGDNLTVNKNGSAGFNVLAGSISPVISGADAPAGLTANADAHINATVDILV